MPHKTEEQLKNRIKDLELEIQEREKDIAVFRKELSVANRRLEGLISELNYELKIMHSVQRQLVPTEIPNIPGFEFSMKFVPSHLRGGDYFDVFEHQDRSHFGIIVASCSGHMMSALLLSVLLKMTGRLEARKGTEPHLIMKMIADELQPNIESTTDTADVFYGLFDRRQFNLSYCKVGDISSMMHEYSSGELKLLKSKTGPLSKSMTGPFETQVVALNPRDKMIFCTKGIAESRNLEGQEFGQDRLFKSVLEYSSRGVHELRNQIFYQVQQFTNGQEPPADRTAVVAEVKDRVIKLAKK
jgi:phosphoserine phosphatase RsbU/P